MASFHEGSHTRFQLTPDVDDLNIVVRQSLQPCIEHPQTFRAVGDITGIGIMVPDPLT